MPAVFHPEILVEEILSDQKRKAEVDVYEALKKTLPDDFHVFYSFNWLDTQHRINRSDGEADFLIAHKDFGYIVLEVKGGVISRDEKSGQWYSKGIGNKTYNIKDPIKQARESKHVILSKLKESLGDKLGFICIKHAVVFPGSGKPKSNAALGADMPLEIFMFLEDMPNLGAKVFKTLLREPPGTNTRYDPLGKAGIDTLIELFSQGFILEPSLLSKIKSCEFKIYEATHQQKKLLKQTENNKRMIISGGAGTGKTSLAIEKAKLLAQSKHSVLFLCFNSPLSKFLSNLLSELNNIQVHTFHQFCIKVASIADVVLPDKDSKNYWDEIPYVLLEALEKNPNNRYDAVIIDEGQDFKNEWLESLNLYLNDAANGFWYFFYDDNQKIYGKPIQGLNKFADTSFCLFENIRNSKPIFKGSKAFYQGEMLESLGPDGLDIEWIEADEQYRSKVLEKTLNKLINYEGIAKSEIAVLAAKSFKNYGESSVGKHECCRADELNSNRIVLDSIYRFKGLEKEVVILMDLSSALNNEQLLYVGFSRARSLLIVIDEPETVRKLKSHVETFE